MKNIAFVLLLFLCFSLCSCGSSTPKSAELSEKYDFYTSSVSGLCSATGVTAEEADEIFITLVNDCGVDSLFTVSKDTSGDFFKVFHGFNTLSLYLDGSTVSKVLDGEKQIYPATPADTSTPEESGSPEETTEAAEVEETPSRDGSAGQSRTDISDLRKKIVVSKVRNDTTGNWRYITLSENTDFLEYALSYYNTYFENDNEIHAVVNFTNKTTTKISVLGDRLEIVVHEYVDGEEHDAKLMYSGSVYSQYFIYLDNGDIMKAE